MMRLTAALVPFPAVYSRGNIVVSSMLILLVVVDGDESDARRELLRTCCCVLTMLRSCHLKMIPTANRLDRTSN